MNIHIEKRALATLLYGILSCQCPVTEDVERTLFKEFDKQAGARGAEGWSLEPFLKIADCNPVRTPLHLFLEFCRFARNDPFDFPITHDDVIRYFCSGFHLRAVLAGIDPLRVPFPPGHIVGHMLLPVRLREGASSAVFSLGSHKVRLVNLFTPPGMVENKGWYGVHLGMTITPLSQAQVRMAQAHLGLLPEFEGQVAKAKVVDYSAYQTFGDHRAQIAARYARHLP